MDTKRKIGPFQVNPVGLGCMNVSFGYGSVSESQAVSLLQHAFDIGCDFFDTATMYGGGENEKLIAKALAAQRKLTKNLGSPEDSETRSLTKFLERLCKHRDFRPTE